MVVVINAENGDSVSHGRLLPSWSTPSRAPFPKERKTRSEKSKPWFLRVNCYAEQSTKSD